MYLYIVIEFLLFSAFIALLMLMRNDDVGCLMRMMIKVATMVMTMI